MKMSVALVAVALLAACGGSSGDSTGKSTKASGTATATRQASGTMSAAAWSRRVEAICVKGEAKAFAEGKKLGRRSAQAGDSKQELTYKILQLESRLLGPWVDQIAALRKPEGKEQEADRFIANMRAVGDLLGQTATAIKQDDAANGRKLVKQLQSKTVTTRSQAQSLNIEKCNPSPQGAGSSS